VSLNNSLKAALGLLVTAVAVAAKLAAYINSYTAAIFDNFAVTAMLLVLMGLGLFMFAYYSLPDRLTEKEVDLLTASTSTPQSDP
jgi:hypothetical protein